MDINFGGASSGSAGQWITVASTLGGIVIGALSTWLLQSSQRRFDAAQRERDRANGLRKDVCVKATETMTSAFTALVSLGRGEDKAEETWTEARMAFLASLQQLQIVGGEKTVIASSDMNMLFTRASADITLKSFKVNEARRELGRRESMVAQHEGKLGAIRDELRNYSRFPQTHQELIQSLNSEIVGYEALREALIRSRDRASNAFAKEARRFIMGLIEPMEHLTDKSLELLDLVRADLGHAPLGSDVKAALKANSDSMKNVLIGLPAQADEVMATDDAKPTNSN